MSWLYGQTWLWYLLAFLAGVLLAWIALVLPASRRLRARRGQASTGRDRATAGPPATDPDPARRPAVDDAATEQLPAVNPALSTLDTFGTGTPARGAATAGLGAAGLGATGTQKSGTQKSGTRESGTRDTGTRDTGGAPPETPATSGDSDTGPDHRT